MRMREGQQRMIIGRNGPTLAIVVVLAFLAGRVSNEQARANGAWAGSPVSDEGDGFEVESVLTLFRSDQQYFRAVSLSRPRFCSRNMPGTKNPTILSIKLLN